MYKVEYTAKFKTQLKKIAKSGRPGWDLKLLIEVIDKLKNGISLEPKYKDHALKGIHLGKRDCHIKPDWVLLYYYEDDRLILADTGKHTEVFSKKY